MVGPLKDNDGLIITKGKEMADALNIYFSSVFTLEDKNNLYENDTAKSVRNIVAQFPVPKGTIKLLVVCSRAFIKAVRTI